MKSLRKQTKATIKRELARRRNENKSKRYKIYRNFKHKCCIQLNAPKQFTDDNLGLRTVQPKGFTLQATKFTSEMDLTSTRSSRWRLLPSWKKKMQIFPEDKMRGNFCTCSCLLPPNICFRIPAGIKETKQYKNNEQPETVAHWSIKQNNFGFTTRAARAVRRQEKEQQR